MLDLRAEAADAVNKMLGAARHEGDLLALLQHAGHDADEDHDAEVGIVPAIDQHRLQRRGGIALGRRNARDDRIEDILDTDARLGRGEDGIGGVEPDHLLDLRTHFVGFGGGQIDLVDDRHDLVIVLD